MTALSLSAERVRHPARLALNALDGVRRELTAAPIALPRPHLRELLENAISSLYRVLDTADDEPAHLEAARDAGERVGDAAALLAQVAVSPRNAAILESPRETLERVQRELDEYANQVADAFLRTMGDLRGYGRGLHIEGAPLALPPFLVSQGLPRLHVLQRLPGVPLLDLGEDPSVAPEFRAPRIPAPKTLEELDQFARAAASGELSARLDGPEENPPLPRPEVWDAPLAYLPAIEEREVLRNLARDALEDIGNLGNLRKPIPTETWLDQGPFEQRLLAQLDYFASLGPAIVRQVAIYHRESDVPDPERAFALAFTLGCIAGSDTVGTVIAVLKQRPPEEWPGFVDGLTLAVNPGVDEQLPELLAHSNAGIAGVALEILGARRTLPATEAAQCIRARGDAQLLRKLARALPRAPDRLVARDALQDLFVREAQQDDELFREVARGLVLCGHAHVRDELRTVLRAAGSMARMEASAVLLAFAGSSGDLELLRSTTQAIPSPSLVRSLGRFGHPALVSFLIQGLRRDTVAEAAGEALERITGAGLKHAVEEPWATGLPEDLELEAARVGAARPVRRVEKIILDPVVWDAWAAKNAAGLEPSRKYRGGLPFHPIMLIDELEAAATPPDRRFEPAFELACILGDAPEFRTDDWVARQSQRLAELRAELGALDAAPGAWWFGGRSLRASVDPATPLWHR